MSGGLESIVCGLGLPLLVLCDHVDLVLCVPVEGLEHDVVAAGGEPDLWLPFGGMLLESGRGQVGMQNTLWGVNGGN